MTKILAFYIFMSGIVLGIVISISFLVPDNPTLRFERSGNLGIGLSAPDFPIHIEENAKAVYVKRNDGTEWYAPGWTPVRVMAHRCYVGGDCV